jgi:hypothetical protein
MPYKHTPSSGQSPWGLEGAGQGGPGTEPAREDA